MTSSNRSVVATRDDVTLETERLVLREPRIEDAVALCDYYARNAERFERWEPVRSRDPADHARTIAALRHAADGRPGPTGFLVSDRTAPNVIAAVVTLDGFSFAPPSATIAYSIDGDFAGRGLASEAVARVVRYAFDVLDFETLTAYYDPGNVRSERLLVRVGFALAGRTPVVPGLERFMRSNAVAIIGR